MPLISTADVAFAMQDFAGTTSPNVVYGAQSCYGDLKREPLVEPVSGTKLERVGAHITLVIAADALNNLVDESAITVDSAPFVIRDVGVIEADGKRILTLEDA